MKLSKRQQEILDYLREYIKNNHFAPSIRDIAAHFNLVSPAGVHKHLKNLEDKGFISLEKNISRSIHLTESPEINDHLIELPLKGKVAAGIPIEYSLDNESLYFPDYMVKKPEKSYVLKVQGDSMVDQCICDGDYVLVESRDYADNGETVIAMINYEEATLKKYFLEGEKVRLQPANPLMEPIMVDARDVSIQGIVVGVIRQYI